MIRRPVPASQQAPAWRQVIQGLSRRERLALGLALVVVLGGVLQGLVLRPAWRLWQNAPASQLALAQSRAGLLAQQAEAQRLAALPPPPARSEQLQALRKATQQWLGAAAQVREGGDRVTVSGRDLSAEAVAQWLAALRQQARLLPVQAQLAPTPPTPSAAAPPPGPRWTVQAEFVLAGGR